MDERLEKLQDGWLVLKSVLLPEHVHSEKNLKKRKKKNKYVIHVI